MNGILPYEELEAAKLSVAFCEMALKDAAYDTSTVKEACDAASERILKTIKREMRHVKLRNVVKKAMKSTVSVAAFIAVIGMATGIAIAGNGNLRAKVVNIMIDSATTDEIIEIKPEMAEEIEIPDGWWAPFYPTYIPYGLTLGQEDVSTFECIQHYETNEDGELRYVNISFCDSTTTNTTIFTEGADISEIMIGSNKATMIEMELPDEPKNYRIYWHEGNIRIYIGGNLDRDEMIKVAEMIKSIQVLENARDISR